MYDATGNEPIDIERVVTVYAAVNSTDASPWGLFEVWYRVGDKQHCTLSTTNDPRRLAVLIRDIHARYGDYFAVA